MASDRHGVVTATMVSLPSVFCEFFHKWPGATNMDVASGSLYKALKFGHLLVLCVYSNAQGHLTPQEQAELLQAAKFTERDIKKIYKRFKSLDTNQNGELDPHELFEVPEIADVSQICRYFERLVAV